MRGVLWHVFDVDEWLNTLTHVAGPFATEADALDYAETLAAPGFMRTLNVVAVIGAQAALADESAA